MTQYVTGMEDDGRRQSCEGACARLIEILGNGSYIVTKEHTPNEINAFTYKNCKAANAKEPAITTH